MLDALIQSKTRLKLVLKFFLNPDNEVYLRGLAKEFHESTNSVRIELNRFEDSGLIQSEKKGNKKYYRANPAYPLFKELRNITFKHLGVDKVLEKVIQKLGNVEVAYLTGELASGKDSDIIDITIIGERIDEVYLTKLSKKAGNLIGKKIRTLVFENTDDFTIEEPSLLIYGHKEISKLKQD